jgi:co-chaperonin GroES (HSP10)
MMNYEDETFDNRKLDKDEGIDFGNYKLEDVIAQYEGAKPMAYKVIIRLYKPISKKTIGTAGLLLAADETISKTDQDNQFTNFIGLVVKMSPGAFKDEKFDLTGRCKVGDWVMFDRSYAKSYCYNGLTTMSVDDDRIIQVIDDPRAVSRISVN